jgi:Sigma-70 region 2
MDELSAELRRRLVSIAYRMIGSATEAEDLVQEAYLRFFRDTASGTLVESAEGVPIGGHDATEHRSPPTGPRAPRVLRGDMAPRADHHR